MRGPNRQNAKHLPERTYGYFEKIFIFFVELLDIRCIMKTY